MLADTLNELLKPGGIQLNGSNPWDIQVHDERWYKRVLRDKNLGLGESYMDGWWDCERIDEMMYRILTSDIGGRIRGDIRYILRFLPSVLWNLQSKTRARIIAERHYDLSNDFFFAFLDPYCQYSCGCFDRTENLEQAQQDKMELICRKLDLREGEHLLDIGCGWGGLAKYAAENYGVKVTAVNISQAQLSFAREFCAGLPIEFVDQDYRSIRGTFDKVVSVGMFEHVGNKNYNAFMELAHRCLKRDGIFLLHTIGSNHSSSSCDPWITKYIFPNGKLPSLTQVARTVEKRFVVEDVHNLGPSYDKTLMAWNQRFQESWPQFREQLGDRFKRMWEYYLLSCAGAFRSRNIQLWQFLFTKHGSGTGQPPCRPVPGSPS